MNPSLGPTCDTNLLSTPTPRRLFTLWMEQAGTRVPLLPQVWAELTGPNPTDASPTGIAHRNAWFAVVEMERSPFEIVRLTEQEKERAEDILSAFTLRHFPALANVADIRHHSDCLVVAQGLACGVDMIVTNNMRSMDHHEINQLVRERWGRNDGFLVSANDALLAAHPGGESARYLLAIALASVQPADQELDIGSARHFLGELCSRLQSGLQMPDTAQRLINTFENDCRIEDTLAKAAALARDSLALKAERARVAIVRNALPGA